MRPFLVSLPARLVAAGLFLAIGPAPAVAQDVPTISVNVKVVNVLATVRDKHGKIVNTLGKDDFVLEEDGRPQAIKYFTRETDLPLTLGLLVDTSLSQMQVIDDEKNASGAFVDDMLRADKDSAFLIHFDEEVELLQDITSSPLKISQSLQELQVSRPNRDQGGGQDPQSGGGRGRGGGHHFNAGTLLYDSIFLASDELMQKQKGRKAIVILTDGVDHGSKLTIDRAIESAQRADTMVYTIYFTGNEGTVFQRHGGMGGGGWPGGGGRRGGGGWPGGGGGWPGGGGGGGGRYPQPQQRENPDGKKVLERISRETGGRMFEVGKKQSITEIYKDIQDELRNQYNIGYSPDHAGASVDYRHIHVTAKQKDLTVQAREGYYASKQMDSRPAQGQ